MDVIGDLMKDYVVFVYFFFSSRRRHTRYIGDWSSDVCSSDLSRGSRATAAQRGGARDRGVDGRDRRQDGVRARGRRPRSEERRVGKECRSGWGPYPYKKKERQNRAVQISLRDDERDTMRSATL